MPLIVVEGVDGSGKTTLVQNFRQVAKRHCLFLARSGPPQQPSDLLSTISGIKYLAGSSTVPLIVDRHPLISEPIYGPIVRGSSMVEERWSRDAGLEYIARNAERVIYCRTELETAIKASRRERQMEGVHEKYWALYQAYDKAMEDLARVGCRIIPYDWTLDQSIDLNHLFLGA